MEGLKKDGDSDFQTAQVLLSRWQKIFSLIIIVSHANPRGMKHYPSWNRMNLIFGFVFYCHNIR